MQDAERKKNEPVLCRKQPLAAVVAYMFLRGENFNSSRHKINTNENVQNYYLTKIFVNNMKKIVEEIFIFHLSVLNG